MPYFLSCSENIGLHYNGNNIRWNMQKINYIIIIITLGLSNCTNEEYQFKDDFIAYKWTVQNISYSTIRKSSISMNNGHQNNVINKIPNISVSIDYEIYNNTDKIIWLYNTDYGSSWQTYKTMIRENIIQTRYYIYTDYFKTSLYGWQASPPYSWVHPKAIRINPKNSIKGTFIINYDGGKEFVNWSIIDTQIFNFFILEKDFTKNDFYDNIIKCIFENYSKEYIIELPIKIEYLAFEEE